MKAVVLCDRGKAELREVEKPQIDAGDILIEVKACGICGSDLHFYYGGLEPVGEVPFTLGHEFAGVIVEMGIDVDKKWSIGERVVSDNTGGACGECYSCSKGDFVACVNRQVLVVTMDGGFTKYVKIPGAILKMYKNCLWKIPENIGFQEATLMDPAANGYNAVIQQGKMKSGENIVVFGVGALGLMAIAQANIAGAAKIIAVGMSADRKNREALALHYGATQFLASDEVDILQTIQEYIEGEEIALIIDAVGHPSVMRVAAQLVRAQGRIIRIGLNSGGYGDSMDILSIKNISLIGHMGYNQESWKNTLALVKKGRLDLKTIISLELPLEEYHKGFEMSKYQEAAKVVLTP